MVMKVLIAAPLFLVFTLIYSLYQTIFKDCFRTCSRRWREGALRKAWGTNQMVPFFSVWFGRDNTDLIAEYLQMLVPNQAVPTQSPHNHCVGSAASKRSSTAELILAFIYTRKQSVTSPKGVKERIFLMNLCWNAGREPRWFLLCNWECKIYRVMLNKWLKNWNTAYSTFCATHNQVQC